MHSRKSIFYRGIVFVVSFLAAVVFSTLKIDAACSVSFKQNNFQETTDEQYVILAGDVDEWTDQGLQVSGGCSSPVITKMVVNGKTKAGTKFNPSDYGAGHYTIVYEYSYKDNGVDITGTIYRYVRILNDNYSLENNYNLSYFGAEKGE